jgi:hypothetical protein
MTNVQVMSIENARKNMARARKELNSPSLMTLSTVVLATALTINLQKLTARMCTVGVPTLSNSQASPNGEVFFCSLIDRLLST